MLLTKLFQTALFAGKNLYTFYHLAVAQIKDKDKTMEPEDEILILPQILIDALEAPKRHGHTYPMHEDAKKGQIYGGECNRTACKRRGAVYYNQGTFGLYCGQDAEAINWQKHKPPLCINLGKRPTIEEMDSMWSKYDFS